MGTGTQATGELTSTEPDAVSNEPEELVVIVEQPAGFDEDDQPAAVLPAAPASPDGTSGSDASGGGTAIEPEPPGKSSLGTMESRFSPQAGAQRPGDKAEEANAEAKSSNGKGPRSQRS